MYINEGSFEAEKIEFKEIKLVTDADISVFKNQWGVITVPQLVDNEVLVGGLRGL